MKEFSKYVKQWQETSIKINEAMQKDDFETADKLIKESVDLYEKYKSASQLPNQNKERCFGELNYMLECELPKMSDRKMIKECMNFVKNDPNLLYQFRFIDALRIPSDVVIGKVERATLRENATTYDCRIRLAADMSRLSNVLLVKNNSAGEAQSLEEQPLPSADESK